MLRRLALCSKDEIDADEDNKLLWEGIRGARP